MSAGLGSTAGYVNVARAAASMESKAPTAFRTISEVAISLDVPQHVLRFWETKFQQIKPLKRGGGRRYYRPEDIALLTQIKDLLYNQGMTIRGVQKLLAEKKSEIKPSTGAAPIAAITRPSVAQTTSVDLTPGARREVEGVLAELKALRALLRQSGV